ncbi:Ubiquitin-conjugating enzyme E2 T [Exaiptasia diaphana]|nr:Ubiquitin-conjugating enzyme E2 T [Exaiptasia diaphana]
MQRDARMRKEIQMLAEDPPHGVSCWAVDDQIDHLEAILSTILLLMDKPNPDDPLMADISHEFRYNHSQYVKKAKEWTLKYATENMITQNSTRKDEKDLFMKSITSDDESDDGDDDDNDDGDDDNDNNNNDDDNDDSDDGDDEDNDDDDSDDGGDNDNNNNDDDSEDGDDDDDNDDNF